VTDGIGRASLVSVILILPNIIGFCFRILSFVTAESKPISQLDAVLLANFNVFKNSFEFEKHADFQAKQKDVTARVEFE